MTFTQKSLRRRRRRRRRQRRRRKSNTYVSLLLCRRDNNCSKVSVIHAIDGSILSFFIIAIRFYSKSFGNKHCRYIKSNPLLHLGLQYINNKRSSILYYIQSIVVNKTKSFYMLTIIYWGRECTHIKFYNWHIAYDEGPLY